MSYLSEVVLSWDCGVGDDGGDAMIAEIAKELNENRKTSPVGTVQFYDFERPAAGMAVGQFNWFDASEMQLLFREKLIAHGHGAEVHSARILYRNDDGWKVVKVVEFSEKAV